jgi:hypothetical protein
MTTETAEPDTLVDEDLIRAFRDQLDEGDEFALVCDRAQFEDCPKGVAEFGVIVARHGKGCGGWRRNYCRTCFYDIKHLGFTCVPCGTRKVQLERYWRL